MTNQKYDFVRPFNDRGKIENVVNSEEFRVHQKAVHGGKLTQAEKNYVHKKIQDNTYFNDSISLLGMQLNFTPVLKTFIVKDNYGSLREVKSFDRTTIRNNTFGGIAYIVEKPTKRTSTKSYPLDSEKSFSDAEKQKAKMENAGESPDVKMSGFSGVSIAPPRSTARRSTGRGSRRGSV